MKSMVATLFLLISAGVLAQNARPTSPTIDFAEAQRIPMEQLVGGGLDIDSDSNTLIVANNSPGVAPSPAMALVVANPNIPVTSRPSPDFHPFFSQRLNRMLVATEFWARGLDAYSTHRDLNDPCKCFHEGSRFLGLNMTPMFKTTAGAYSYSLGLATAYSFLSARLWNASKDHPRHARLLRTLSRVLPIGDSSMEVNADVHNLDLQESPK